MRRHAASLQREIHLLGAGAGHVVIGTGAFEQRRRADALGVPAEARQFSGSFWAGLGSATLYAVYDYLGYNNICSYAGEVRQPAATIPRSIVVSVVLVAALYLAMNVSIISAMPWQDAAAPNPPVGPSNTEHAGDG